ncbi:MAG: HEAT repeat domain-containing protein, partial [Pirellulaceae bacterium]|nr:HEAT repeat domain-containing protein [Pirellulaceae bacterium]
VHTALIKRWDTLSDRWKNSIAERGGRVSGAVRDAILSSDAELRANGCDAVLWLKEYDLIPALVNAAEESGSELADLSAQTLIELGELLFEELAAPRDYQNRRDPQLVRRFVLSSLEKSVDRFEQHKRDEIIECFLLLTKYENSLLRAILQNPKRIVYDAVVRRLSTSSRPGVTRLLLQFLDDSKVPPAALHILARRRDVPFVRRLLKSTGLEPTEAVLRNIGRVDHFAWATEDDRVLAALNEEEQEIAMNIVVASSTPRMEVFDVLRRSLESGNSGGRRSAATALEDFQGNDVNHLLMDSLHDADPDVQATLARQLRERGIPGAMSQLIALVESPHEQVRQAAFDSLTEFNFERFLGAFDMLEEDVRASTGSLVRRIDANTVEELREELDSPSRMRRLRAVQIAPAVGAVDDVTPRLLSLLDDDDHFIRADVVKSLTFARSPLAKKALEDAVQDRNPTVRAAAEQALWDRSQWEANIQSQGGENELDALASGGLAAEQAQSASDALLSAATQS